MSEFDTFMTLLNEATDERIKRGFDKGDEKTCAFAFTIGFIIGYNQVEFTAVRQHLMRLGRKRLGPPGKRIVAALESIGDLKRLDILVERVAEVDTWRELLATE